MNGMASAHIITSGLTRYGKSQEWGNIPAKYRLYTYDALLFNNLPTCEIKDKDTPL
jgi:hypothetical protein